MDESTLESQSGKNIEGEKKEKFSDLIIFTTTHYGQDETSAVRSKLALNFLKNARELGIRCVVLDASADNLEFRQQLRIMDNVDILFEEKLLEKEQKEKFTMGEGRREALKYALGKYSNTPYLMWSEPEKDRLITADNLSKMILELRNNNSDIVVPARSQEAFKTLPNFQSWEEQRASKRTKTNNPQMQNVFDLWFGPKMFNHKGASYFANYKGRLDKWDSIIKPAVDAFQDGARVESVEVDYTYDKSQKEHEENNTIRKSFNKKRWEQYWKVLGEMGDEYWKEKYDKYLSGENNDKKF